MKKIILENKRILLRSIRLSDASHYVDWFVDKEVVRYLGNQKSISLSEEREYIKNLRDKKNQHNFAIVVKKNKKHIGSASIRLNNKSKRAEFGIIIGDKEEWGKGYARDCIELLKKFIFNNLSFNKFYLYVSAHNQKALKAYQKAGFQKEAKLKKHTWNEINKKFEDIIVMSIFNNK